MSISVLSFFFSVTMAKYLRKLTQGAKKSLVGDDPVGKLHMYKPEDPSSDPQSLYDKMDVVELPLIPVFADTERRSKDLTGQSMWTMGDHQVQ